MKRLIYKSLAVLAVCAGVMACGKPRIIPDSTLSKIFYDAFLTNAYLAEKRINSDSLELYEPIFEKYGYTAEDLQYTIGNFSKRKSARLGNVVEVAIARLEAEGGRYDLETSILDTIDARARRAFSQMFYTDTLVTVHRLSDTARLHILLDSLLRGDYEVAYTYNIDSLDKNIRQRTVIRSVRDGGIERIELNNLMQRRTEKRIVQTVKNDGTIQSLKISLAEFDGSSRTERPHMTFRDITVRYIPLAEDVVDSLYERTINLGIFNMKLAEPHATDSLPPTPAAR